MSDEGLHGRNERSSSWKSKNGYYRMSLLIRVGKENLVESVIADAIIWSPGGPHLGAPPGLLSDSVRHTFRVRQ